MKWIGYLLLGSIFTVVVSALFLLNSTKTIKWAADRYAPQYGFGYKKISGGLLSGLELDGLTFRGDKLLGRFTMGWNPVSLLHRKVSVTHLEVTDLEVGTIEKIIDTFFSGESDEGDKNFSMPVSIGIGDLHIEVDPFKEENISIDDIDLKGKGLYLSGSGEMEIDSATLHLKSALADLSAKISLADHRVDIHSLTIENIDTPAIDALYKGTMAGEGDETSTSDTKSDGSNQILSTNPLVPESVMFESAKLDVKPAEFEQFSIKKATVTLDRILVNLHRILSKKPNAIEVGKMVLELDTNLTDIDLNASLENEKIIVDALTVREIDTLALKKIAVSLEGNESGEANVSRSSAAPTDAEKSAPNPLIPKILLLKYFEANTKSAKYDPIKIKNIEVNASDILFDIVELVARSGTIDINATSSFADLIQHGEIHDNHIRTVGHVTPLEMLYETYKLPIKRNALGDITLDIDANDTRVQVEILLKGKEILQTEEGAFNVNRLSLSNHITYLIPDKKVIMHNEGNVTTPYTENLRLDNLLTFYRGVLSYHGEIVPGPLEGIDANYTKPLEGLKLTYHGNLSSVEAVIDARDLKGRFVSPDFKKGDFNLSTKSPIILKNIVSLPEKLQESKVAVQVHVPIDLEKLTPLKATARISSNIANLDADLLYDKEIKLSTKIDFPKDSLLRGFSEELKLDALNPLRTDFVLDGSALKVDLRSQGISSKVRYGLEDKNVTGDLVLGGAKFVFGGNLDNKVTLENRVGSIREFIEKVNTIYTFEAPPLDGDIKLSLNLMKMKELELLLHSHTLTYKAGRDKTYDLNDTMVSLGFADSVLKLNGYHTTFQKQKIFATKPSVVSLKEGNIEISPLWVNDELKVTGIYNIEQKKGEILAKADLLDVSQEMVDLKSRVDIRTKLDGVKTNVEGRVTILGARVHYDMDKKSFASDSDIIIVQDMKKKGDNPFMDNLSAHIIVDTKKPILYKTADADIKATVDMQIQKSPRGPIYVLGTANILKGSKYTFQDKKFVFKKSIIAFTGDASKPILDIKAVYDSINYEITIQVTGTPQTPNIIFSSVPRLSREQILSVLLFDSEDAAGSNSGDDMMKMMGGAMAKSVLSNVGIKIDHLSLGTDGSVEIGKKISDRITIIYVKDEVAGAKLQYDYSKNIKAVISTDSESSGADIIYRREFKKLPFFGD